MRRVAAGLVLLATATLAAAAEPPAQPAAAAPPPPPSATIDRMEWLKGYWAGEGLGGTVESLWGPAKGGVMIGAFRHIRKDGKPGFYEILSIEENEGSLKLVIKHFHPNWVGWEEKDHAMQRRLSAISRDEMSFGGIVFRRIDRDNKVVEMVTRDKEGNERRQVLRYRREKL